MKPMLVQSISAADALSLRQKVLRPHQAIDESRYPGDEIPGAAHFGVIVDSKVVSIGTVHPERCDLPWADSEMKGARAWRLRGMATDPEHRAKGYGAAILDECLKHAKRSGGTVVWCNARVVAFRFYLKHRFQRMSSEYEMPGIGPHFLMKKDL